jgi:3-oxoacyl-[acyl-carrier protein] reductase
MNCALVTGGSRGIGRAICLKLAAMGYFVLVNYKGNEKEAENTMALIKTKGGDGELLQFDVALKDDIQLDRSQYGQNH